MAQDGDGVDTANSSAPDLQILGDEITLQPSGFIEPQGKEQALMNQFASFRAEPLQYAQTRPKNPLPILLTQPYV